MLVWSPDVAVHCALKFIGSHFGRCRSTWPPYSQSTWPSPKKYRALAGCLYSCRMWLWREHSHHPWSMCLPQALFFGTRSKNTPHDFRACISLLGVLECVSAPPGVCIWGVWTCILSVWTYMFGAWTCIRVFELVFVQSELVLWCLNLFCGCPDLYFGVWICILGVWTCIWVSELVFGCLDLYSGYCIPVGCLYTCRIT